MLGPIMSRMIGYNGSIVQSLDYNGRPVLDKKTCMICDINIHEWHDEFFWLDEFFL